MAIRDDLELAFKPKMLSAVGDVGFAKGLKAISYFFFIWLAVHIVVALVNGAIDGQSLGGVFLFSLLVGLSVAVMGLVGLLVLGFVSAYASKLFGGEGDLQKTLGLISIGVLPIVLVGVFRDLLLLVSAVRDHFLADYFVQISVLLFVVTFAWLAWMLTEAIAIANDIKKSSAFVCFVIGFIVASLVNWPVNWVLVKLVTYILTVVL